MCTFMTELPARVKGADNERKPNLIVYIKPTEGKDFYRFRLLAFKSAKSDRTDPFISKYIHQVWFEGEDGKRHSEAITCPVSPYVKEKWNGDPMNDCPICRFANANFIAWKQSNWKDKEAARKNREFGRKFEVLIPVYVISDPVYEQNNGHMRVFAFNDKEQYKTFIKLIREKSQEGCVFNGQNAFDFYIKFKTTEEVLRKGQPNEFIWRHAVLDRMGFTTKAYDIPAITKEAVDDFPFDETFYLINTKSELQDFYDRHIKISNDDIPDEDEIEVAPPKQTSKQQTIEVPKMDLSKELDDLNDIPDEAEKSNEAEFDDLLDGNDEDTKVEQAEEVKAPVVKKEEPKDDPIKGDTDDIDSLLADIL